MQHASSRRHFVKAAAASVAAPFILPSRVWSAETAPSERLNLGFIGVGKMNSGHLKNFLGRKEVQVIGVCDVDTTRRVNAKKTVEETYGKDKESTFKGCTAYADFRELVANKDIDAVVIATPDHWHTITSIAPLGDVDVMCTPVADHAAAVFAGHAPGGEVIVDAARAEHAAVGRERGRTAPHVPVEARLHGLFGVGIGFGGIAELRFDALDLADDTVADEFAGDPEFLAGALLGAGLQHFVRATGGFDEGEGLVDIVRQRFFAVHVFSCFQCGDGGNGVPVVRRGDDHGVDVLVGDEFAEVGVGCAALDSIKRICRGLGIAAGLPENLLPEISLLGPGTPSLYNDPDLTARVTGVWSEAFGKTSVIGRKATMAGEDFSRYTMTPEKIPVFLAWLGTVAPEKVEKAKQSGEALPSLHSPFYRPEAAPSITTGIKAMTLAVMNELNR